MKKFIALSLLAVLTLGSLSMASAYSGTGYPYHEPSVHDNGSWDSNSHPENWTEGTYDVSGIPEGSDWAEGEEFSEEYAEEFSDEYSEDEENAYDMADELDELYQDMDEECSDLPSKALNSALDKIDEAVKVIIEALQEAENGQKDSCNQKLREGIALLEKAINQFEVRECRTAGLYKKRCIPQEIVQQYKEEMLLMLEQLKEFLLADTDEDGIADVCTWEDFMSELEDENWEDENWNDEGWKEGHFE